ncbi:MAG TPA: hypothetical protein PKH33_05970 [bacterium]|nr:hypothetical protein [bacterium]
MFYAQAGRQDVVDFKPFRVDDNLFNKCFQEFLLPLKRQRIVHTLEPIEINVQKRLNTAVFPHPADSDFVLDVPNLQIDFLDPALVPFQPRFQFLRRQ